MKSLGVACLVLLFIGAFTVLGFTCHVFGTAQNSVTGVIDKTLDSDNVIYNYEYFHNTYNDIKANEKQLADAQLAAKNFDAQFTSRQAMEREDKAEADRLHAIVTGLQQMHANLVSTYNARSEMANRNIFKSGDLPSHLN